MITTLDDVAVYRYPPGRLPGAARDLLIAAAGRPGDARHVSDLLAAAAADDASVYLPDPGPLQNLLDQGQDPQLYRAYRDVVAPRDKTAPTKPADPVTATPVTTAAVTTASEGTRRWFADLVVYPDETIGQSGRPVRSLGHWNTAAQLEVFQCLAGRVLMLHTGTDVHGRPTIDFHECQAGEHTVIPFGAWHLTVVLDAPAAVFNVYTDVDEVHRARADDVESCTARQAAGTTGKYRGAPAPALDVVRDRSTVSVTWSPDTTDPPTVRRRSLGEGERSALYPAGLAALYQRATPVELDRIEQAAVRAWRARAGA